MADPVTKTQKLIALMRAGDWNRALALANTFRMLGEHRQTIQLAHEARVWPSFWRQLGKDPEAMVKAGIAALQQLYPSRVLPQELFHATDQNEDRGRRP